MGKQRYTVEEKNLLIAGIRYAEANGIPKTRLSWSLASLMNRSDSTMYHQVSEMARVLADLTNAVPLIGNGEKPDMQFDVVPDQDLVEDMIQPDEDLDKRIGEIVDVQVISLMTYGALCSVKGTTRTLLLHISEMADAYIDDVTDYVKVGDSFPALLILGAKNRLALSTRRVHPLERRNRTR